MKDIPWTQYGVETEHSRSAYQGETKMFKVEDNHIYFNTNRKFVMGVPNFIVCCCDVESVPVSPEADSDQVLIGEDDGHQVYLERVTDHDIGDQEQVGIILRDYGKWYSWIRFTMDELLAIAEALKSAYGKEDIESAKQAVKKPTTSNQQNTTEDSKVNLETVNKVLVNLKAQIQKFEEILGKLNSDNKK